MAKKPSVPERHAANLSHEQIKRAIPRLQKRIDDLRAFDPATAERSDPRLMALQASIEQTLRDVFGADTHEFHQYRSAAVFNGGPIMISGSWGRGHAGPDYSFRPYYEQSRQRSIALLEQAIKGLEETADYSVDDFTSERVSMAEAEQPLERRVFIVHGHDDGLREAVARFLEKIGFEPIILHERPNKGRALITKFHEEAAGIGFAVVLMTPDDLGGKPGAAPQARARQNVVFELGFFIGALGPSRVAAIVGADVEPPSDYDGVVYISQKADWKTSLARELKAAGFEIDWNKVMD